MHGSKLPLTVWFWAAYLMATHSNGISALQLQKQLGLGSYKSAWLLGAKLRRAMVAPDRRRWPAWSRSTRPRSPAAPRTIRRPAAAGAATRARCSSPARSRCRRRARPHAARRDQGLLRHEPARLHRANLAAGATAKTDGWAGYPGAPDVNHEPHVVGPMAAHVVLPWTHRVFSNLKTWALGVYHGLRRKHLQAYLDEFVFRFNRRRTRTPPSARSSASASPSNPPPTTC